MPIELWGFLAAGALGLFGFLAVASWSDARRREREAYYRSETLAKVAAAQGAEAALTIMREERETTRRRQIEGQRLGGMITTAVGVGLMVFLYKADPNSGASWMGIIPILIGLVLAVYSYLAKQ